ncbi:hypothetical protein JCM3765_001396 [Sporobolomyces pararoseus]
MASSESSTFPSAAELVDRVPLIKNPAFWVHAPVEVPLDIHPLPEDVQAYFVYPHTLESHVLSTLPNQLAQLEQTRSQRIALLESYEESKERARKAKLQALAPGWNEGMGGVMQPVKKGTTATTNAQGEKKGEEEQELIQSSPTEMGEETMDKMQRDQMQDWFDKWDGGSAKAPGGEGGVGDLI